MAQPRAGVMFAQAAPARNCFFPGAPPAPAWVWRTASANAAGCVMKCRRFHDISRLDPTRFHISMRQTKARKKRRLRTLHDLPPVIDCRPGLDMGTRFVFALLTAAAFLCGQDFRATITGRLVDSSDAAVPNATVMVKNVATNETSSAVTRSRGEYTVPFLRPGAYQVSADVPGFKKFLRSDLVLNVGQVATVDIRLEIGSLTEQITVSGEAPLLDSAMAERGAVIDHQRVLELPLNGRNPMMLSS